MRGCARVRVCVLEGMQGELSITLPFTYRPLSSFSFITHCFLSDKEILEQFANRENNRAIQQLYAIRTGQLEEKRNSEDGMCVCE